MTLLGFHRKHTVVIAIYTKGNPSMHTLQSLCIYMCVQKTDLFVKTRFIYMFLINTDKEDEIKSGDDVVSTQPSAAISTDGASQIPFIGESSVHYLLLKCENILHACP